MLETLDGNVIFFVRTLRLNDIFSKNILKMTTYLILNISLKIRCGYKEIKIPIFSCLFIVIYFFE